MVGNREAAGWRACDVGTDERVSIAVGFQPELGRQHPGEDLVGRTDQLPPGQQLVVAAVDGAEADRQQRGIRADDINQIFAGGMSLGNFDLNEDLGKVGGIDGEAGRHV